MVLILKHPTGSTKTPYVEDVPALYYAVQTITVTQLGFFYYNYIDMEVMIYQIRDR